MKDSFSIVLFLVFAFFNSVDTLNAQDNYKITIESAFADLPPGMHEVGEGLEIWKKFILTQNDSLLVDKDRNDTELVKEIHEQLFCPDWPKSTVSFHITAFAETKHGYILETMCDMYFPESNFYMMLSYFRIGVRKENGRERLYFLTDDYLAALPKKESKWFTYYSATGNDIPAHSIKIANDFCDSVSAAFGLPKQKANYILVKRNRGYEVFGHYYHWNAADDQVRKARGRCLILDNDCKGAQRHEIVHYLFDIYQPPKILDEGMATYLAGSLFWSFKDAIDSIKSKPFSDTAVLKQMLTQKAPYWQPVYFYGIGGIVIQHAYKTGGAKLVKELLTDHSSNDVFVLLRKHFNIPKNESAEEFLVELISES